LAVRAGGYALMILVLYVLSSGPVLGLGFWLRDVTNNDMFYAVMWLYFPLLAFGRFEPLMYYIEWWVVDVFQTVGPG
jgi:hypothetical protein